MDIFTHIFDSLLNRDSRVKDFVKSRENIHDIAYIIVHDSF